MSMRISYNVLVLGICYNVFGEICWRLIRLGIVQEDLGTLCSLMFLSEEICKNFLTWIPAIEELFSHHFICISKIYNIEISTIFSEQCHLLLQWPWVCYFESVGVVRDDVFLQKCGGCIFLKVVVKEITKFCLQCKGINKLVEYVKKWMGSSNFIDCFVQWRIVWWLEFFVGSAKGKYIRLEIK